MTLIAFVFPKLWAPQTMLDKYRKKSLIRGPFDKKHGKRAKALSKSTSQHLYHIQRSLPR